MMHRRLFVPVLAATLMFAACKKDPPPPPGPTGPTADELAAQARADSIANAERMAQDAMRQAQAEADRMAREAEQRMAAARATLEEMVFFDYDESTLSAEAERILRAKLAILRASSEVMIRIEGHADERGSTEYNIALGNRRAEAVRQFFTGFGLAESRFAIRSYGEERPLNSMTSEAAWSRNRRAEFVITAGENQINPGM